MKRIAAFLSVMVILYTVATSLVGCATLSYKGGKLADATVGVYYLQDIDTAESNANEEVTYLLDKDSALPEGLSLDGGSIVGTPLKAVNEHKFSLLAVSGQKEVKADYSLTVATGKLTYEDAEANVVIDSENSGTVAFATGGINIQYELIDGTMPNGLTINSDGQILGSYPRLLRGRKVTVRASAQDCEPAEAKITINVVNPFLTLVGKTLVDAKQGVSYAASVAYVEQKDAKVSYSLKEGNSLPEGLTLSSDGLITGVPTIVKRGTPFVVVAKANGYSDAEAEFVLDVILNKKNEREGKIVGFSDKHLDNAFQEEYYLNQVGVSRGVVALNNNNVTYTLADGQEGNFPEGLHLYPNGAIFGKPESIGASVFKVVASAAGCDPVEAEFSIVVNGSKIKYETSKNAEVATRGEEYAYSIATASAGEGVQITYSTDSSALSEVGLSLNSAGMIVGTPTKSVKSINFKVTASAEGYSDAECTVYMHIQEPLTVATVFEAEYTDLTGKQGTGYSGAPGEEALITNDSTASNGRFLNFLHNDKITIEFEIYADENTTAELALSLGSELNNIDLTPATFDISVNDVSINYGHMLVVGGKEVYAGFAYYSAGSVNLVKGKNIIKLSVKTNTFKEGVTGGPGIDSIKLTTDTTLRWHPRLFNIRDRS